MAAGQAVRALGGLVMLAALACGVSWVRAGESVTVPMDLIRVSPRAYYVLGDAGPVSSSNQGFNANAGFVVTDEGVVVFDALGTPALGAALLERIRRVTREPVRHVIVSHYHADHFYGLQAFKAAGARVWAHRSVRDYLASDAPRLRLDERRESLFPWVDEHTRLVEPDVYVEDESSFALGGVRFELRRAGPAHTPEDLMMLVHEEGVLFAGDLIFAGRVPFVGDADSRAWIEVLERFSARAPRVIVTGHGRHSTEGGADLSLTLDYLRFLRERMREAVEEMIDFEEAYARTDWSRWRDLPAFGAANRRNAYNTFLLMEREALKR